MKSKSASIDEPVSLAPIRSAFGQVTAVLVLVAAFLFFRSFLPGMVLFSNDGPLGAVAAEQFKMPGGLTGMWQTLNWVGGWIGNAPPNFTYALFWLLGPVGYAKFYVPLAIIALGWSAWLAFRQQGFQTATCALGALAAALNGGFFSYACWGLGSLTLAVAAFFLAIAAWGSDPAKRSWARVALAGFAIGLGVMEGFDNGAILSVFFAAYVMVRTLIEHPGQPVRLVGGLVRLLVVAVMAGLIAAHAMLGLVQTQVKGVAGMAQDDTTRQERWEGATQWSLPKLETLRLFIPGLYGYRMDTPEGGAYWGGVGRSAAWDAYLAQENPAPEGAPNPGALRFSGSGFYSGVFVCLLAAWALFASIGNRHDLYRPAERKLIWFWAAVALGSLLLAWGKYAPFYAIAYELPYFSTIRNPIKFLHPLNIAVVILFAYGIEGLWRSWERQNTTGNGLKQRFGNWWRGARGFERHWLIGSLVFVAASILLTLIYASAREEMMRHLMLVGYADAGGGSATAAAIFRHSTVELLWFLLFLAAGVVVVALLMSGALRRSGSGTAALVLALVVLSLDLIRSNRPWIVHYDYQQRYASTELYELLADQPWEHRAQFLPGALLQQQFNFIQSRIDPAQLQQQLRQLEQIFMTMRQVYGGEWAQHQFQYYNVQSLDVVQEPRPTIENTSYRAAFSGMDPAAQLRLMRLTNARYFLGFGGALLPGLNQFASREGGEFRDVMPLWIAQEGEFIKPARAEQSPFSLIEFTGALPRAGLYANWRVESDPTNLLQTLASPEFDPGRLVLVEGDCPAPANPEATDAGTVTITDYHPKLVQMKANVRVPAVLLFNDKHDPNWKVWVDGQPAPLLKANYLMRGLHLAPGEHEIVWRFQPPTEGLYVSIAAIFAGLVLTGFVVAQSRRERIATGN